MNYAQLADYNEPIDHYQAVQWMIAEKAQERKAKWFFLLCLLFGAMLVASACGPSNPVTPYVTQKPDIPSGLSIDPDLKPYWDAFVEYGQSNGYVLPGISYVHSVQYVDSLSSAGENTIGLCYILSYEDGEQNRSIEILRTDADDPMMLKLVMWHEMGHCILNLQHTPENSNTIMQPTIIADEQWAMDNWAALVKYEFDSSKGK